MTGRTGSLERPALADWDRTTPRTRHGLGAPGSPPGTVARGSPRVGRIPEPESLSVQVLGGGGIVVEPESRRMNGAVQQIE